MEWFIAKLTYRIVNSGQPQFDEQLRLIQATTAEEAFLKAKRLGISEEDAFLNEAMETVKWEFINISDLRPAGKLVDGAELYSCVREEDELGCRAYIRDIHQRAHHLQTNEYIHA